MIHLIQCDSLNLPLKENSVHCVITSPPYWGLRDYGVEGQIGLERTPEEYVSKLVQVFREVRRVLRADGSLWLNLGDSYNSAASWGRGSESSTLEGGHPRSWRNGSGRADGFVDERGQRNRNGVNDPSLKPKDLVGIPWRVAFALQADGWYLRSDIIWDKRAPMPESVQDRCTRSHEYLFMLAKSERYYFDGLAIAEPLTRPDEAKRKTPAKFGGADKFEQAKEQSRLHSGNDYMGTPTGTRNKRDVWRLGPEPFHGAHYAVMPQKLVEPCILAGTSAKGCCPKCGSPWERIVEIQRTFESGSGQSGNMPSGKNGPELQGGGKTLDIRRGPCLHSNTIGWQPTCSHSLDPIPCTVLDPFAGTGTVGIVSARHGRRFIGLELDPKSITLAEERTSEIQRAFQF